MGYTRARSAWYDWPDVRSPTRAQDYEKWDQAVYDLKTREVDAADYGSLGTSDDGPTINAAIADMPAAGGTITLKARNFYAIQTPIVPKANVRLTGFGARTETASNTSTLIVNTAGGAVIEGGSISDFQLENLHLRGTGVSGSRGINAAAASGWTVRDSYFSNFGDEAIKITGGAYGTFRDLFSENCLLVRSGRADYIGVFDIGCTDAQMYNCWGTPSFPATTGGYVSGFIAGIVLRGTNADVVACTGQFGEVGIVVNSDENRLISCRGEFCQGPGFAVTSAYNQVIGSRAHRNSQTVDNGYPGFTVTNGANQFIGNRIHNGGDAVRHSNGFNDTYNASAAAESVNEYYGNKQRLIRGVLYNFTGTSGYVNPTSVIWTSGAGSPETVVTARVGSLYTRTDGGAVTTLYVKESGTGNTGWVAK